MKIFIGLYGVYLVVCLWRALDGKHPFFWDDWFPDDK